VRYLFARTNAKEIWMSDIKSYFVENARLSRRSLAQFLDMGVDDIDQIADDLGVANRLTLADVQEIIQALSDDDASDDDDDDDDGEEE